MERYEKVSAVGFLLLYSSGVYFVDGIMRKKTLLRMLIPSVEVVALSQGPLPPSPPSMLCYLRLS